jgi:hypothetical protein
MKISYSGDVCVFLSVSLTCFIVVLAAIPAVGAPVAAATADGVASADKNKTPAAVPPSSPSPDALDLIKIYQNNLVALQSLINDTIATTVQTAVSQLGVLAGVKDPAGYNVKLDDQRLSAQRSLVLMLDPNSSDQQPKRPYFAVDALYNAGSPAVPALVKWLDRTNPPTINSGTLKFTVPAAATLITAKPPPKAGVGELIEPPTKFLLWDEIVIARLLQALGDNAFDKDKTLTAQPNDLAVIVDLLSAAVEAHSTTIKALASSSLGQLETTAIVPAGKVAAYAALVTDASRSEAVRIAVLTLLSNQPAIADRADLLALADAYVNVPAGTAKQNAALAKAIAAMQANRDKLGATVTPTPNPAAPPAAGGQAKSDPTKATDDAAQQGGGAAATQGGAKPSGKVVQQQSGGGAVTPAANPTIPFFVDTDVDSVVDTAPVASNVQSATTGPSPRTPDAELRKAGTRPQNQQAGLRQLNKRPLPSGFRPFSITAVPATGGATRAPGATIKAPLPPSQSGT